MIVDVVDRRRGQAFCGHILTAWLAVCVLLAAEAQAAAAELGSDDASPAQLEFFESKVRPILSKRCFECHGPQAESVKGGLRMSSQASLLRGGDTGPALVPGNPDESLLVDSIRYSGVYEMPPDGPLPPAEREVLERWVREGAAWPAEEEVAHAEKKHFDLQQRKSSHWCWRPLSNPELPMVNEPEWCANAIDRFILARLEEHQITPAPRAAWSTLLRRLSFDLSGIPPTAEEVQAFLQHPSTAALDRTIDRLLSAPQFGERWARHWMDLVRYAETYGHEMDYELPYAFEYRDYLIRAFNLDVPYDQFVREHLAGDVLDEPRRNLCDGYNESIIGSGFWWLGEAVHAPTDVTADEADRLDNMVDVMSKTFLGLTVACARCHDHKFDAISTQDYHSLVGYVQSTRRQRSYLDPQQNDAQIVARMRALVARGSDQLRAMYATDPSLGEEVYRRCLLAVRDAVRSGALTESADAAAAIARAADTHRLSRSMVQRWVDRVMRQDLDDQHPLALWREMILSEQAAEQAAEPATWNVSTFLAVQQERFAAARTAYQDYLDHSAPVFDAWPSATDNGRTAGEAFRGPAVEGATWDPTPPGGAGGETLRPASEIDSGRLANAWQGSWNSPTFVLQGPRLHYRAAARKGLIRVYIDGHFMNEVHQLLFGGTYTPVDTEGNWRWHQQNGDLNKYVGHRVQIEVVDEQDGFVALREIRHSDRDPVEPPPLSSDVLLRFDGKQFASPQDLAAGLAALHGEALRAWDAGRMEEFHNAWLIPLLRDGLLMSQSEVAPPQFAALRQELEALVAERHAPRRVLVSGDGNGLDRPVYIRGNHRTPGDMAPRRLPVALGGETQPLAPRDHSGRRELADRTLGDAQHFVARVMVNRVWHHLFGRGIVPTVDNFGVLGKPPTHPELLDYLAQELIRNQWSLKHVMRLMLQSETYRMSSAPCAADQQDPANQLWHRALVRRLQGEAIRDALLYVSGDVRQQMYGPSVPIHLTPFMDGRGRPGQNGPLDGNGRRSIYIEVRRNFLSPMMLAFDTPIPFNANGRRGDSNVPAQALMMLNDPFVLQQAERWAESSLRNHPRRRVEAQTGTTADNSNGTSTPGGSGETCELRAAPETTRSPGVDDAAHVAYAQEPRSLSDTQRIDALYLQALSRLPYPHEQQLALRFLDQRRSHYQSDLSSELQREHRAWSDLCHVIMNLKEFVFLH